jgi:hypothetical protein
VSRPRAHYRVIGRSLGFERLEQRTLLCVGPPTVSFDPDSGVLEIAGGSESNFVSQSLSGDGFVELNIDGAVKSSNVASPHYDPAMAGAIRETLHAIEMAGGGGEDRLFLADQSLPGSLLIRADCTVSVGGAIQVGTRFAVTAATIEVGGSISAPGGFVSLQSAEKTLFAGSINVSAAVGGTGGRVEVLGPQVELAGSATITACGDSGGGVILIGGDYQGSNPYISNSRQTLVEPNARLNADGLVQGDGGKVIVWSDEETRFRGAISVRGGARGGDGGFVEVSGKNSLRFDGPVDALAPRGAAGTLLLDPKFVVVATGGTSTLTLIDQFADNATGTETIDPSVINAAAANVVIQANTDITINNAIAIAGSGRTLTLQAGRDIVINANVTTTNAAITMTANSNAATSANRDAGTGDIVMAAGTTLSSGIGAVTLSIGTSVVAPFSPGSMTLANITTTSGTQSYAADEIDFIGGANSVVGISTITLRPALTTTSIVVAGASDSGASVLDLTTTDLAAIKDGFSGRTLGQAASTAATTTTVNTATFTDPLTVFAGLGMLNVAGTLNVGANALSLQGDEINLNGGANSIIGTSSVTLQQTSTGVSIVVAAAADSGASVLDLTSTDLVALKDGFTGIVIGLANATAVTTTTVNSVTFTDPPTLRSGLGTLNIVGALNVGANALSLQGNEINLSGGVNSIIGTSSVTLQQTSTGVSIAVAGAADSGASVLDLISTDLTALKDGFTSIVIGLTTATAATTNTVNSATFTDPLTLRAGLGTLAVVGVLAMGANALTLQGNEINLNGGGNSIAGTSTITIQPTSTTIPMVLGGLSDSGAGNCDLITADLAALANGFSAIAIGLTTSTVGMTVNSVTFLDPVTLQSGGVAGSITLAAGAVVSSGTNSLTFTAGTGNTGLFTQTAGASIANTTGAITINADSIALNGSAGSIAGAGAILLRPRTTTRPTVIGAAGAATDFALSTAELTTLADGFSAISIGLSTSTVGMTVNSATFLDPVTLQSGGAAGSITLAAGAVISSETESLTFTAGTGNTGLFTQAAGASIANTTGGITINADSIDLGGAVGSIAGAGTILLTPRTTTRPTVIGAAGAATDFALSTAELATLADGFTAITIGLSTSTVGMTVNSATFSDPVTLQSGGVAGSITLAAGAVVSSGTNSLTFTAGTGNAGLFTQAAGASIANTTGGITINADSITLSGSAGSIASAGAIVLTPRTAARPVVVGAAGAATDFALSTAEVAALADGFSGITIGSNALTSVATISATTFSDPIMILMGGASGDITLNGALTTAASNAAITLTTGPGGGGTVTQTAGAGNTISAGSGAITINADNIVLNTTANTISGTGAIVLSPTTASRPVVIGAAGAATDFALSTAELAAMADGFSNITIGSNALTGVATISSSTFADPVTILMGGASGDITLGGTLSTAVANASISLITGTGGGGTFTQTAGAGNIISAGSGTITINADNILLNTTANTITGTGTLSLSPTTVSRPVVIGAAGTAADFALSATELASLSNGFGGITIGSNSATGTATVSAATFNDPITILMGGANGRITVGGAVSTSANDSITLSAGSGGAITLNGPINAGSGNVSLISGGSASQTAAIAAAGLLLSGTSTFVLNAANDVDVIAADINGSLSFSDVDDLAVGTVGSTVGISTGNPGSGGDVAITSLGYLTVNAAIDTSDGSGGTLTATGAVLNVPPILGAGSILLSGLNHAPILDLDADNSSGQSGADFAAAFIEDHGAVAVADVDAALTDVDSPQLASLTATITNLLDGTGEILTANVSGTNLSASYNSATGTLLLTGADTIAKYQQVLRTVSYDNASQNPNTTVRLVSVVANDGLDNSNVAVCRVTVTAENDAPTSADHTVTTNEDTAYVFSPSDFPYSDIEGDALAQVKITALPTHGTLRLNGTDVVLNQVLSAADIAAGNLVFTPAMNANGAAYDSFGFQVYDGTDYSAASHVMTINVTPLNDAPTSADHTVTTNEDTAYVFSPSDFPYSDIEGDGLAQVKITALPTHGTLRLVGTDVVLNQVLSAADIAAGNLVFTPAANANGAACDSFLFLVHDGTDYAAASRTMSVNVTPVNDAPTSTDHTVTMNEDTAFVFSPSDFPYSDIEADGLAQVKITALPTDGTLRLAGTDVVLNQVVATADIAAGNLVFTPAVNANGAAYDSFGFQAHDGTDYSAASHTMTINVTPVNDAPTLTPAAPSLGIIAYTSSKTVSLTATFLNSGTGTTTIVDVDDGADVGGIAVTGITGGGVWEFALDGTAFQTVGSASPASALLLAKGSVLRYTPSGPDGAIATVTYRAWDATTGINGEREDLSASSAIGGATAFSNNTDTVSLEVRAEPRDITISSSSLPDDRPTGTAVGTLNAVAAPGGQFSYALVSGPGSTDNISFSIDGNILRTAAVFNAGVKASFDIRVRATDQFNLSFEKAMTITLIDVTPPSVTINEDASQTDPTHRWPVNFHVVFSEPVTDFTADDVLITGTAPGATVASITGNGADYYVHLDGMTSSGTVTATIPSGGVRDVAGNPNLASTSTDNTVLFVGNWASYIGTPGSDIFILIPAATPGGWSISVNGIIWNVSPAMQGITLDGDLGGDSLMIVGGGSDESLEIWQGNAIFRSGGLRVEIANIESLAFDGGRGTDAVVVHDRESASDVFSLGAGWAAMNDRYIPLANVESCTAVATPGSNDTAILFANPASAGRNEFSAAPDAAIMTMPGRTNTARGFTNVQAYTTAGGGDTATFSDAVGDDIFVASPIGAQLFPRGGGYDLSAWGFSRVTATAASGNDLARFYGKAGGRDTFVASPRIATYTNAVFENTASGFATVEAYAAPNSDSTATLIGSDGVDHFVTSPLGAQLFSQGINNSAWSFRHIFARSIGGNDSADMYGASTNNNLSAESNFAEFSNASFCDRAVNFAKVRVHGSGGAADSAVLDRVLLETGIHDSPSMPPTGISVTQRLWLYDFDLISTTNRPLFPRPQPQVVDQLMTAFMYE